MEDKSLAESLIPRFVVERLLNQGMYRSASRGCHITKALSLLRGY
jgi:hypothetical protein